MVTYEFQCRECNTHFETPVRHDVTHCGKLAKRKYSLGGIAFRGSGFYSNDQ